MSLLFILPITFLWALMWIFVKYIQWTKLSSEYILLLVSLWSISIVTSINLINSSVDIINILKYSYIWFLWFLWYFLFIYSFKYINIWLATLISNFSILFAWIWNFVFLGENMTSSKWIILFLIFIVLWIYTFLHYKNNNKDLIKWIFISILVALIYWIWYILSNYASKESWLTWLELKNSTLIWWFILMSSYLLYKWKDFIKENTKIFINKKYYIIWLVLLVSLIEVISDSWFFQLYKYNNWTVLTILTLFEIIFSFILWYMFFKEKNHVYDYIIFAILVVLLWFYII